METSIPAIRRVSLYPSPTLSIPLHSQTPHAAPGNFDELHSSFPQINLNNTPTPMFQEQDARLKQRYSKSPCPSKKPLLTSGLSEALQDGPSEPSGSYAYRIADKHFRPLDPSKKRKCAVRRPIEVKKTPRG